MTSENKRWFIEKVAQNPEYLSEAYLPAMERCQAKAESDLRNSIRNDDTLKMKYKMGFFDGVCYALSVIDGLRLTERKPKSEPGLMARIFSRDQKEPA